MIAATVKNAGAIADEVYKRLYEFGEFFRLSRSTEHGVELSGHPFYNYDAEIGRCFRCRHDPSELSLDLSLESIHRLLTYVWNVKDVWNDKNPGGYEQVMRVIDKARLLRYLYIAKPPGYREQLDALFKDYKLTFYVTVSKESAIPGEINRALGETMPTFYSGPIDNSDRVSIRIDLTSYIDLPLYLNRLDGEMYLSEAHCAKLWPSEKGN